jgi:outer membrane protein assembly factor BamB
MGGGVLVADRQRFRVVNPQGQILDQVDDPGTPLDWLQLPDRLLIATQNPQTSLWSVDTHGIVPWQDGRSGLLARAGDRVYLYAQDGLYRLDPEQRSLHLVHTLAGARLEQGTLEATQDGTLWLVHSDGIDRRLLSFSTDGDLLWERSLRSLNSGNINLVVQDNRPYIFLTHNTSAGIQADLYAIDPDLQTLTHILSGGSRTAYARGAWIVPLDPGTLLLNIPGGPLVAFNPLDAYRRFTALP